MSHKYKPAYYIGLMSGTSMDGIDAALVSFDEQQNQLIATHQHPWPESVRSTLKSCVTSGTTTLFELGQLDASCGAVFAEAAIQLLNKAQVPASDITAIGSHGQTLCHGPQADPPFSLQVGDPNLIAERTGITTIADFRRRDMAAGGQGAPLVPAFHQAVFQKNDETRIILNIGGIANITVLPGDQKPISGFDTGSGNCLMDYWIHKHMQQSFDVDGNWAMQGDVVQPLLEQMLADPYFQKAPPKSTGTEYFSPAWLNDKLQVAPNNRPVDIQRTLMELTAKTIAAEITKQAPSANAVFICGGGVHNSSLMERIQQLLPAMTVTSTAQLGVDPDWVEAQAFAWLARQTMNGQAGNLPEATGASRAVILGGIYPVKSDGK